MKNWNWVLGTGLALGLVGASSARAAIVLTGKPAFAISNENATNTPEKAFDGSSSTRWASFGGDATATAGNPGRWIYVDLGQVYDVTSVVLDWEAASARDYQVIVSNTETPGSFTLANWTNVGSATGYAQAGNGHGTANDVTFNFVTDTVSLDTGNTATSTTISNLAVQGRYLGAYVTLRNAVHGGTSLFEISVNGTPVPEPSTALLSLPLLAAALRRRRRPV